MPRQTQPRILASTRQPTFFAASTIALALAAGPAAASDHSEHAHVSFGPRTLTFGPERTVQVNGPAPEGVDVAVTDRGDKVFAWSQLGGASTVICIRYAGADDQDRTPARGASQGGPDNDQPSITADDRGNIGIFWRQSAGTALKNADGSSTVLANDSIVGRFFDNESTNASTGDIVISDAAANAEAPQATTDKNGNSVVTWQEGDVIRARQVGAGGALGAGPFEVNDIFTSSARQVALDSAASGDFVTTWREDRNGSGIRVRRFDEDGNRRGALVLPTFSASANTPQIAMADSGDFAVTWEDSGNIFARAYQANGTPKGSAFQVNQTSTGLQRRPSIDANSDGDFVIVWESDLAAKGARQGGDLVGRFFSPEGDAETDEFTVAQEDTTSSPERPNVSVDDSDTVTVVFERRTPTDQPAGIFRREIRSEGAPEPCVADAQTLCLNGGRFRVRAAFQDTDNLGDATRITPDTGFFTFFDPANIEVVVKVLDACSFAGRFWVFAAGLTDVEVDLRVEDTQTGVTVAYFNRGSNTFTPVQDTGAFDTCSAKPAPGASTSFATEQEIQRTITDWLTDVSAQRVHAVDSSLRACSTTSTVLCLAQNRFTVQTSFRTSQGTSGVGQAVKLTPDTGYFWFFDASNVEVVVKVLDACGVNGRYWVFAGGLTDVRVDMTVTDTNTGQSNDYLNRQKTPFQTITDTNAFPSCP